MFQEGLWRNIHSLFFLLSCKSHDLYNLRTVIRPEVSRKNRYWISKHRHYELKHFCLQYSEWKKTYTYLEDSSIAVSRMERLSSGNNVGDPTAKIAMQ